LKVAQNHLESQIFCTDRMLRAGMEELGHNHSLSCIQKWKKAMGGEKKVNYIKPTLTAAQKLSRLQFCQAQIVSNANGKLFAPPHNRVHVDETWYYIDVNRSHCLIFPGQKIPEPRRTRHKSNMVKVMCLAAIGYPHHRPDGSYFDGKIGVWPLVEKIAAKRKSCLRAKGTLVSTPCSMNAKKYVECYAQSDGIVAEVKKHLYHLNAMGIVVQHDGAAPHTGGGAPKAIKDAFAASGLNAKLVQQPAQSPDLNVLDLGLFNGMKSDANKIKGVGKSVDTCIERMQNAFRDYSSDSIAHVFGVLYEVYRLTIRDEGDNIYVLPHSGVRKRQKDAGCAIDYSVK